MATPAGHQTTQRGDDRRARPTADDWAIRTPLPRSSERHLVDVAVDPVEQLADRGASPASGTSCPSATPAEPAAHVGGPVGGEPRRRAARSRTSDSTAVATATASTTKAVRDRFTSTAPVSAAAADCPAAPSTTRTANTAAAARRTSPTGRGAGACGGTPRKGSGASRVRSPVCAAQTGFRAQARRGDTQGPAYTTARGVSGCTAATGAPRVSTRRAWRAGAPGSRAAWRWRPSRWRPCGRTAAAPRTRPMRRHRPEGGFLLGSKATSACS